MLVEVGLQCEGLGAAVALKYRGSLSFNSREEPDIRLGRLDIKFNICPDIRFLWLSKFNENLKTKKLFRLYSCEYLS